MDWFYVARHKSDGWAVLSEYQDGFAFSWALCLIAFLYRLARVSYMYMSMCLVVNSFLALQLFK